jgi:hypothetical protein
MREQKPASGLEAKIRQRLVIGAVWMLKRLFLFRPAREAADKGDTATMDETLIEAGMAVAALVVELSESNSADTIENGVAVMDQVLRRCVVRECLAQLLNHPGACWMAGDVEVRTRRRSCPMTKKQ